MKFFYRGRSFSVKTREFGFFKRPLGLMFRTRETQNLVFPFKKDAFLSITAFCVFFPFLALWLDKDKNVIEWKLVKPFTLSCKPRKKYRYLVELPVNRRNQRVIAFFVGKHQRFK